MFYLYAVYIAVFLFVWLSSFVQVTLSGKKQYVISNFLYVTGAISLLLFSIGLVSHSGDYDPYTILIADIEPTYSLFTQDTRWDMEYGFIALCWFFRQFSNDIHLTFVAITLLPLFFYVYRLNRYSAIPLLSLAIYIAHFHWWIGIVLVRQMYAVVFILVAVHVWLSDSNMWRKTILYYLLCVIAYNFHNSSVVFLILPLVLCFRLSFFWQCVIVAASFVIGQLGVFIDLVSAILPNLERGETYMDYLELTRGLNSLAYVEKLCVFFFLFAQRKYFPDKRYAQNILMFYTLCLSFCGIFFNMEVSSRFSSYFDFFIYLFIIPLLLKRMPRKRKTECFIVIALYLLIYFIRFIMMLKYMAL